jgi:sortase A
MVNQVYVKTKKRDFRKFFRFFGLGLVLIGVLFGLYAIYPLISWQLYIKPVFANNNFASPIPQATIMTEDTIKSLLRSSVKQGSWLPYYDQSQVTSSLSSYALSIPQLNIKEATVSTTDTDISKHLVHFPGTALPPTKGNAVIFGHSTLPQFFDPTNYKTIFANAHNLKIGDKLSVTVENTTYVYKIFNISIVDPEDISYLTQTPDDSNLTIVTCTPPGTIWKRLIIKASIEKI